MKKLLLLLTTLSCMQLYAQGFLEKKLVASDRGAGDLFGRSVSISGDYAIVGAILETEDVSGGNIINQAGSAYIFERSINGVWNIVQKLVASDRAEYDVFGHSVSISGNYAIVAAHSNDENNNTLINAGSAYIFERNINGTWIEVKKLVASDRNEDDLFGISVSISGDYAIIGAAYDEVEDATGQNTLIYAGSAYIFERGTNGTWSEVKKLVASDRNEWAFFGLSVSISGNYAVVGTDSEGKDALGENPIVEAGAAYVFERKLDGTWTEVQKLVAYDRTQYDRFGTSVSISGDYIIIGAVLEDENAAGENTLNAAGSAYIFERGTDNKWKEVQKIVASDRFDADQFGYSVCVNGNKAIVGVYKEDEDITGGNTLTSAGSAYVFERDSESKWNEISKIVASDRNAEDYFGYSVSISGDYILIGACNESEDINGSNTLVNAGSAYLFESKATSIHNQYDFNTSVITYPNPTNEMLKVDLGKIYNKVTVDIINAEGRKIFTQEFESTQFIILEIKGSSGMYFVKINLSFNETKTLKIIKY